MICRVAFLVALALTVGLAGGTVEAPALEATTPLVPSVGDVRPGGAVFVAIEVDASRFMDGP